MRRWRSRGTTKLGLRLWRVFLVFEWGSPFIWVPRAAYARRTFHVGFGKLIASVGVFA